MKKLLSVLLLGSIFCLNGNAQTFSGGEGSSTAPYFIKNVADMAELATVVNGGNTLSGKFLRLENDITYKTTDVYTTIGYTGTGVAKKFAGSFDGNGHSISSLKLTGAKYISMFASVDATGIIKNLTLKSPVMTCSDSYGGFIAGQSAGIIENCRVEEGNLNSTNGSYKGGIAGYLQGTIRDCSYSGTINTSNSMGGIVGQNYGNIENCQCSATIVSLTENSSSVHIGGIASVTLKLGGDSPTITDCYFTGNIQGGVLNNCGGISATFRDATMERCWNGGYISSTGNCGGLVGNLETGTIRNSYNIGTLYDTNSDAVGGIAGTKSASGEAFIENCLSLGSIFNSILARNEDGEFIGQKNGDVTFTNSYFDAQVAGWGSKNYAKSTKELTVGNLTGFDASVWTLVEGMYPRLKKSAQEDVAILNATPFFLADGESHGKVYSSFKISSANGVEWEIKNSSLASIEGNTVKVTRGTKLEQLVLYSYLGSHEKRSLISIYPKIFKGTGSESDPYLIENKEDLMKLSNATNNQEMSFTGEYFKMTGDIDMELDKSFVPFCLKSALLAFDGVFDGNGYSIKNLFIDTQSGSVLHCGLFRTIFRNGIIKNLKLDKSCQFKIYRNFGSFAEYLYGVLDNCSNYADIPTTEGFTGGLAAFVETSGAIRNSYNEGNVSATAKNGYLGGITYNNKGIIENCQNNGNIISLCDGSKNVGGIAGANEAIIKNALNAGQVYACDVAGGICATNAKTAEVTNVLSLAPVITTKSKENIGGITGSDLGANYKNAYFDSQIVIYKNIAEGINGVSTSDLVKASWKGFGDDNAWSYAEGKYPVLKNFMSAQASELAAIPVILSVQDTREDISGNVNLPSIDGLIWTLKEKNTFKIENGILKKEAIDTYSADELTGTYHGYQKVLAISTLGNILPGNGTSESPWLISKSADLVKLSAEVGKSQNSYGGKCFKIANDIDMTGISLTPIAEGGINFFNGIIDGNNKTISNLTMQLSKKDYVGLFGRVGTDGHIFNLTIGEGSVISGNKYVGAFAGTLDGTLENCKNDANVSSANGYAGGFIGAASQTVQIKNLTNSGNISNQKDYTGGIAGEIKAENTSVHTVTNSGKITGTSKVGGIAGSTTNVTIIASGNKGEVTGSSSNAGGICGYMTGSTALEKCFNEGEISGGTEIGGLVGYHNKAYSDPEIKITKSFNAGNVTATSSTAAGILARGSSPEISECFNTGDILNTKDKLSSSTPGAAGIVGKGNPVMKDCYNMGNIGAYDNLGGLVSYPNTTTTEFTLTNCYSAGPIVCNMETSTGVGAILGKNGKLKLENSYYDRQVIAYNAIGGVKEETGINTATLITTDFGNFWNSSTSNYPVLKEFASNEFAQLYSAPLLLATEETEDTYQNVTRKFKVSTANNIKWSGDEVFTINGENITIAPNTQGEHKLIAQLNKRSREITLALSTSGVGIQEISQMALYQIVDNGIEVLQTGEYSIYTLSGTLYKRGVADSTNEFIQLEKGIYLIKIADKANKIMIP